MRTTTALKQTRKIKDKDEAPHLHGPKPHRHVELGRSDSLAPKHGIRNAVRLSLQGRLCLKLPPRRGRNCAICGMIGDALERVCDSGQLEGNLVGSVRPFQHDDAFAAEVQGSPEQQPNHDRYNRHERVMTGDCDTSARNSNHVILEQDFRPGWAC